MRKGGSQDLWVTCHKIWCNGTETGVQSPAANGMDDGQADPCGCTNVL